MKVFHVLNLGAGVQSTALYLLFLEQRLQPQLDAAIFADTQDEPLAVYRHLDWLDSLGGPRIIRVTIGKLSDGLVRGENSTGQRWVSIPAFTEGQNNSREGKLRRQCSKEYKIIPIRRAIREQILGVGYKQRVPYGVNVQQYIGISMDEAGRSIRIRRTKRPRYLDVNFPLIERLVWSRQQCQEFLATRVPHPVPKSACVYCPYHDDREWLAIKADPHEWSRAVAVDEALRSSAVTENRKRKNNLPMYLHRSLQPLVQIVFDPKPRAEQGWLGFSRECMGVCGI